MFLFAVLLVAVGLSMDTFTLSLSYGLFNLERKEIIKMSVIVGLFHFFMPLLGNIFGELILSFLPVSNRTIIGIIFLLISFDIIVSFLKKEELKPIENIFDIILFSFTVSLDSFSTGIGLDVFNLSKILIVTIFMITSFLFTYFGLSTGKIFYNVIGRKAEIIGLLLLLSLSLFYLIY